MALTWREATLAEVLDYGANRPRASLAFAGPWPPGCSRMTSSALAFEDGSTIVISARLCQLSIVMMATLWIGEPVTPGGEPA